MTENTMAPAAESFDDGEGSKKKLVFVAGGLAGLLVLGGAGFLLMSGGSSEDEAFTVPTSKKRAAANVPAKAAASNLKSKVPTTQLPAASTIRIGRDPFAALYVLPAAPKETVGAPVKPGTVAPVAPATGGTGTPTKTPVATTYPLKLTKVAGTGADRTATFSVNGKTQLAKVGSVFGKTSEIKLLSFTQNSKGGWIVVIQVGDADPFDLALGETILVM